MEVILTQVPTLHLRHLKLPNELKRLLPHGLLDASVLEDSNDPHINLQRSVADIQAKMGAPEHDMESAQKSFDKSLDNIVKDMMSILPEDKASSLQKRLDKVRGDIRKSFTECKAVNIKTLKQLSASNSEKETLNENNITFLEHAKACEEARNEMRDQLNAALARLATEAQHSADADRNSNNGSLVHILQD